jgi:6-pyruvoyltetrahydropterin/6-carboxytetrahydropterin synthase
MIHVTRKVHFNAAHRLHNPAKSAEWNAMTYGLCNHENWHGHNYVLEVTVAGMPDPDTGYVMDLGKLRNILEERILSKCDHRNLNLDVPFLMGIIPSSENLVIAFYHEIKDEVERAAASGARVTSVKLFETDRNVAEYRPGE